MERITTEDGTEIYYKDWGSGQPIVFSHGWPLSADDWDGQMLFFGQKDYRIIAHDRRGHGRSSEGLSGLSAWRARDQRGPDQCRSARVLQEVG
jgi:non-heme chloroperoxidase